MSTLPASVPVQFPGKVYVDATFFLLGITVNSMLFGILWVQVYLYYAAFPTDTRTLKWIVFVLLSLEIIQTAALTRDTIQAFVFGFSNPSALDAVGTAWYSIPLLTGLIACITQGLYCYRIGVLTRSKYAVAWIIMLSLGQLVAAIVSAIQTKRATLFTRLLSQKINVDTIGIWGGCNLACDILIAAIMTHYLRKRDSVDFENTHRIIVRLMRLSIETGCITALSAGALVVLPYLPGHPRYYELAASIAAKTYSNAMMAVLNSRVQAVSNAGVFGNPLWNEAVQPSESIYSARKTRQGIMVYRESEMGLEH
ncbi:hypothetical protein HYPSUDRAFT_832787 [Hypholoma sublateritium FD-334 SS-4]|uniref:DUF6534 domain-containing protein n=1 Tax=Hypholoma sublateritium (strain FD-334 SS-4) TaxID=945553 RepID=A0A0D2NTS6_HYPSF|nr:hypothetical protein HYPSUDRAFT_832787 [Hypholoma sublateritium FD-334 SS-4]